MKVAALRFLTFCYLMVGFVLLAMSYLDIPLFKKSAEDIFERPWGFELPVRISTTNPDQKTPAVTEVELTGLNVRPLFAQTRKPFVVKEKPAIAVPLPPEPVVAMQAEITEIVPTPPVAPAADPSSFRLMGTSQIDQELRALISDSQHPEGRWLILNDSVMDWLVKEIKPHEVLLVLQDQSFTLKQYVENNLQPLAPILQNQ